MKRGHLIFLKNECQVLYIYKYISTYIYIYVCIYRPANFKCWVNSNTHMLICTSMSSRVSCCSFISVHPHKALAYSLASFNKQCRTYTCTYICLYIVHMHIHILIYSTYAHTYILFVIMKRVICFK